MESRRFWAAFALLCIGAVLMGIVAVVLAIPAHAAEQPVCAPWKQLDKKARDLGYSEKSMGFIDKNKVVTLMRMPDDTGWVLMLVGADGTACILFEGDGWVTALPQKANGPVM